MTTFTDEERKIVESQVETKDVVTLVETVTPDVAPVEEVTPVEAVTPIEVEEEVSQAEEVTKEVEGIDDTDMEELD